jgi:hypothetical protein
MIDGKDYIKMVKILKIPKIIKLQGRYNFVVHNSNI